MTDVEIRSYIVEYLTKAVLMQVATAVNANPWVCSVYFAFDDELSLYWISSQNRRHSKELRENNHIAGAIVLPHTPGNDVQGIQFEGTAQELREKEKTTLAMKYYAKRFGMTDDRVQAIIDGSDGHMCYKITPSTYVLFDEVHFPKDSRQEYRMGK